MVHLDVWLYGPLSRYADKGPERAYANVSLSVPEGTTMGALLRDLGIPPDEKGITFVNGRLTDMAGLGADSDLQLKDGDRIGLFHDRSMWPFQYRHGASVSPELNRAMTERGGGALRHSPG